MKNNYISKIVLSLAVLGFTTYITQEDTQAKQVTQVEYDSIESLNVKVMEAEKAVNKFKQTKTIKSHRIAQKAVNKIHSHASRYYAIEKQKLQKQINIVLKYNEIK